MSESIENIQFKPYTAQFTIFEEREVSSMRLSNQDIYKYLDFWGHKVDGVHAYLLEGGGEIKITPDGSKFSSVDITLTMYDRKDKELQVLRFDKIKSDWIALVNDLFGMNFQWEALRSAQQ